MPDSALASDNAAARGQENPDKVTVIDGAKILHADQIEDAIKKIKFSKPVSEVVVLTAFTNSPSDYALNDYVRKQAQGPHKDWLNPKNPDKYRDGLLILAVDPAARLNGAYSDGELLMTSEQLTTVLDASKPAFRTNRWSDGMIDGARAAADIFIGNTVDSGVLSSDGSYTPQPQTWWQKNDTTVVTAGVSTALVGGVGGSILAFRAKRTRRATELLTSTQKVYSELSFKLGEMDVNAATLPADSTYAVKVRGDVAKFEQAYREATQTLDTLGSSMVKGKLPGKHLKSIEELSTITFAAAGLESRIESANAILNRHPGWETQWEKETAPLFEAMSNVDALIQKSPMSADSSTARALREITGLIEVQVPQLQSGIAGGSMTPDAALTQIDEMSAKFEAAQNAHVDTMIATDARTEYQRNEMQRRVDSNRGNFGFGYGSGYFGGYNYGGGLSSASVNVTPTTALIAGYTVAQSAPSSQPSSSGGGGYSGGGSFSGGGGSSRF